MAICTRFAPSPTGYLHIGGARTALFSWLYARQQGGKFILRIEDTDRERSTQAAVDAILQGMAWLGLDYDEGPTFQTERFDRYQVVLDQLLAEGKAYKCYCSKERLQTLREQQMANKEKPRYDGHCRDLGDSDKNQPYVVRFRNPQRGSVIFDDLIRGSIEVQNSELDDLIIARSDGTATYNLTVVVDDWDMGISHVIRGDDHINNTPRQINLLNALNAHIPYYAHVPMILGADGKRLSKRHGAVSVLQYRDEGFLPEALLNYLVRLGWSSGDKEVFSLEEMIELFDMKSVNSSAATFNPEKLLWLNQHYILSSDPSNLVKPLAGHFQQLGIDISQGPDLLVLIEAQKDRVKTLLELAENSTYFYQDITQYDEKAAQKNLTTDALRPLRLVKEKLGNLSSWDFENIHQVIQEVVTELDLKMGQVAQPIRIALTGGTRSPSIDQTIFLLGTTKVERRLTNVMKYIQNLPV